MRDKFLTDLPIVSWNVHGLFTRISGCKYNKLHSPFFMECINNALIFCCLETHHTAAEIDQIQITGYKCFNVCRKKRKVGRNSGGIAVYVDNNILEGVQKIPSSGSENVLIKLKANYFGFERDLALCFSYCVPQNSSFQVREQLDVYGDLELKLSNLGNNVDKLCLGDFNARTGAKFDYLPSEDNTDIPVPSDIYETDAVSDLPRLNMDIVTNKYGDNLLSLCKSVPLRICNGRKLGDILGSYTCYTFNGQSCVDYCLASPGIYDSVATMSVGDIIPTLSDHCPIRVNLNVRLNRQFDNHEDYNFITKLPSVPWNKEASYKFENILQSTECSDKFEQFLSKNVSGSQSEIDNATFELSNILVSSALQASSHNLLNHKKKVDKLAGSRRKCKKKTTSFPKWHDISCSEAHRAVLTTARFLRSDPKNPYLKGKLQTETKLYNKLIKSKHKEFVNNMFSELDSMEHNNPRGYMQLVKSMREGSFDKVKPDDTSGVSPSDWFSHFSNLLSKPIDPERKDFLNKFTNDNIDSAPNNLSDPITAEEFDWALKNLKNNKASSFDRITNEILKISGKICKGAFLHLFNSIGVGCFYPNQWKKDILHPIHKSNEKDDPNNFRGISISSCFGKLFIKILKNRLQSFIDERGLISKYQGSGKASSRTADHLMVIQYMINKIVKGEKKKLYTCFVDIKKAYDCTNRELLYYMLLTQYEIGGNFLKILQSMYDNHEVFIRVSDGLLQPIKTTIGLKQGCGISPLLFNLFIDKITEIFDETCDPVNLAGEDLSCLLWADDLILMSSSPEGLQNSINKTSAFYTDLGLELNTKKTKVIVFNSRGIKLNNHSFYVGGFLLEVVDNYQYLGIKLKPSGSLQFAASELFDKASKAWFAISNILYQHKKMAVRKALQLFDSLVKPIYLYAVEFWLPFIISKKGLGSTTGLLKYWEGFQPEILNQKVCRLLLSVHKKCSRLAVLGELGRYPALLPAVKMCLKYEHQIKNLSSDTLINRAFCDMKNNPNIDSWYSRVKKMKTLLSIPELYGTPEKVGNVIDRNIKSKFDRFFLDQINQVKTGLDGNDHNKLRLYKTFKGTFRPEPYITEVKNRNQRVWLSRYRTSAHNLRIESGRYTSPVTPVSQRVCVYCDSGECDTEEHAILVCKTFQLKRQCFFGRISSLCPNFDALTESQKLKTILCPATATMAKCVSKFLGILSNTRKEIDLGFGPENLVIYRKHRFEMEEEE